MKIRGQQNAAPMKLVTNFVRVTIYLYQIPRPILLLLLSALR